MPIEDREQLTWCLRRMLFDNGFAYTLFGDKPISIDCFDLDVSRTSVFDLKFPQEGKLWKKYIPLLSSKNYIFLIYDDCECNRSEVTLINRRAFQKAFMEHREKFVAVFGARITAEKLLSLLIHKKSLWNTAMKNHQDLIGILLGFGKVNAELYQRRAEITGQHIGIYKIKTPMGSEWADLQHLLQGFQDEKECSPLQLLRLPDFVADLDHPETIKLKKKYTEQRRKITEEYARGNFLKVTMDRFDTK